VPQYDAARRAIGHRSPFFSRSTGPPSFRTCQEAEGLLHPDHGNTRFTPNPTAWIYLFRVLNECAKRHQAKPGKVRETIQNTMMSAHAKKRIFEKINGISVPQNL